MVFPLRCGCLLLAFLLGAGAACEAEWLVAIYGGAAHTSPGDLRIQRPSAGTDLVFPDVPFDGKSLTPPIYYGYRIAHSLPGARRLFIEAEFIHAKAYARGGASSRGSGRRAGHPVATVPFDAVVQGFSMSHGLNFILFNLLARQPLSGDRLSLTARAGVGPTVPHAESDVEGDRREQYEFAGAAVQVSGGVEIRIWRALRMLGEYKWTRARPRVSIAGGSAEVATRSHHLAIGLASAF